MGQVCDGPTNELHFVTLVVVGLVYSSGIMHHVKYHDISHLVLCICPNGNH